jgi:hypothetical protein
MGRREVVGDHLLTSSCFSKSYCMLAEDGEYFYVQCILIMAKVHFNIVTCMRFPWFNNVSTAITMG